MLGNTPMKPQAKSVLQNLTNEQLYWLGHFLYHGILKDDLNIGNGIDDAIGHYCYTMSDKVRFRRVNGSTAGLGVDADDIREKIVGAIFKLDSAARHTTN
jgi:hypothetical protein